jgi:hypothetical protein
LLKYGQLGSYFEVFIVKNFMGKSEFSFHTRFMIYRFYKVKFVFACDYIIYFVLFVRSHPAISVWSGIRYPPHHVCNFYHETGVILCFFFTKTTSPKWNLFCQHICSVSCFSSFLNLLLVKYNKFMTKPQWDSSRSHHWLYNLERIKVNWQVDRDLYF